MKNHVLLNNIEHQNIKIITERSEKYGDNIRYCPTFFKEFSAVQAHYPILFEKDPHSNRFTPVALFGFERNENLFLNEHGWDAAYLPISVQRLPFLIGFQESSTSEAREAERVVILDMDSPRVNTEQGEDLFLEFGGNSDYLERIAFLLESLHRGLGENEQFMNTLVNLDLLEPITLDIELIDNSKNQMIGFYTINDEALRNLSDSQIIELHRAEYLPAIYLALASQSQLKGLVDRKNRLLTSTHNS